MGDVGLHHHLLPFHLSSVGPSIEFVLRTAHQHKRERGVFRRMNTRWGFFGFGLAAQGGSE